MRSPLRMRCLTIAIAVGIGFACGRIAPAQEGKVAEKAAAKTPAFADPNHGAPNGTKYRTFSSGVLGGTEDVQVSYLVFLPPGYDEDSTRRYPVIYWLHGLGGNQRGGAFTFLPYVARAIRQGDMPPAVVVLVNGLERSFYCDWVAPGPPVESVIIKDLIPHIDQMYRTVVRREGRVIQGYSMGGFGAGHLGFKYPDLFGTVIVDAGALIQEPALKGPRIGPIFQEGFGGNLERFMDEHPTRLVEKNADRIRGRTHIRIGVGSEDNLLARNRELHELLDRLKIEHEFVIVPDVAHNAGDYYRAEGASGFAMHKAVFSALHEEKP